MPTTQENTKENQKWNIPQGCGLEKLKTILVSIRNKNGDKEYIDRTFFNPDVGAIEGAVS